MTLASEKIKSVSVATVKNTIRLNISETNGSVCERNGSDLIVSDSVPTLDDFPVLQA
jgi:hypothetical protein